MKNLFSSNELFWHFPVYSKEINSESLVMTNYEIAIEKFILREASLPIPLSAAFYSKYRRVSTVQFQHNIDILS